VAEQKLASGKETKWINRITLTYDFGSAWAFLLFNETKMIVVTPRT